MDAVFGGVVDVERKVLNFQIFFAVYSVSRACPDVECALAFELQVTLAVEASVVFFVGAVGECVGLAFLGADGHALAVLQVKGGPGGVGDVQAVELHGAFVGALEVELAVVADAVCLSFTWALSPLSTVT